MAAAVVDRVAHLCLVRVRGLFSSRLARSGSSHKRASHFSCPGNGRQFKTGLGLAQGGAIVAALYLEVRDTPLLLHYFDMVVISTLGMNDEILVGKQLYVGLL